MGKIYLGSKFSDQHLTEVFNEVAPIFWLNARSKLSLFPTQEATLWEKPFNLVEKLLKNLSLHHPESALDSIQGGFYAIELGKQCSLIDSIKYCLGIAVQDAGKVFVPKEILNRSETLSAEEKRIIATHVPKGYELLLTVGDKFSINQLGPAILEHHMQWSSGEGTQSFYGSVIKVLDVIGALSSSYRYYGNRKTITQGLAEMEAASPSIYNPAAVTMLKKTADRLTICSPLPLISPER